MKDKKLQDDIDLNNVFIEESLLEMFPENFCIQNRILPFSYVDGILTIISEEENIYISEEISSHIKFKKLIFKKCEKGSIFSRIRVLYRNLYFSISKIIDQRKDVGECICDKIILDAFAKKASDVHFCPGINNVIIKYRVDGSLKNMFDIDKAQWASVSVRIKILSELDISETRIPQDGSFSKEISEKKIDFRVACHPTMHGENIVLRVLGNSKPIDLHKLNYSQNILDDIMRFIDMPNGLIIFTGPVGSGKTTSLYSMLSHLDPNSNNIVTLEDPIESYIPLIRQTDINKSPNMTFATGIKSLLRQDPNIMLIGEIRDAETAQMVMRATMTGHKVFTTMHTSNSLGVLDRLSEFGLEKSLISQYLRGIISQRLVRKLCSCKSLAKNNLPDFIKSRIKCQYIFEQNGCEKCDYTGFKGRIIVAESICIEGERFDFENSVPDFITMDCDAINKIIEGETVFSEAKKSINFF